MYSNKNYVYTFLCKNMYDQRFVFNIVDYIDVI